MMATHNGRIYQTSDLSGRGRKEFIEAAQRGPTTLRTPEGESLVMLPAADLEHLAGMRDHALNFLMLDNAMSRPREQRRAADFGGWAFVASLDDAQLAEFHSEINDALIRAGSGQAFSVVDDLLDQWRLTASLMADPVSRGILEGSMDVEDWSEVSPDDWATAQGA